MDPNTTKTVAFLGASTGVGLSTLQHTLEAGHQAIALCRTPSKLTDILSLTKYPNLKVIQGDAYDVASVMGLIRTQDGSLVDQIVSTIGGKPTIGLGGLQLDDPNVCQKGMETLIKAISQSRVQGATGHPLIVACSGLGNSRFVRDYPLALYILYQFILKVPRADKQMMEKVLTGSGEDFVIVRPAVLTSGKSDAIIRVGVEDPLNGPLSKSVGYTISREDAGKWMAENLVLKTSKEFLNKNITMCY